MIAILALVAACVSGVSLFIWGTAKTPETGQSSALGIPITVTRPNAPFVRPYSPAWKGLRVRFDGDIFLGGPPRAFYTPLKFSGRTTLPWGGPHLIPLAAGATLTILDDQIHDLELGELFVRAKHEKWGINGYVLLSTFIGETSTQDLWAASDVVRANSCSAGLCFPYGPLDAKGLAQYATAIANAKPDDHPLTLANMAAALLSSALRPGVDRSASIAAGIKFFDRYVFPQAVAGPSGSLAWAHNKPFTVGWNNTLSPPWFSAYTNSAFAVSAALMHHLTGEQRFRDTAIKAARFVGEPIEKGGAEYNVSGFRLPAEYVYRHAPNIRVLDGEIIALIYIYNTARLTGDRDTLAIFSRQAMSLAMQLSLYQLPSGAVLSGTFSGPMPPHYNWIVWLGLQNLAAAAKDRRFLEAARAMKSHIPIENCALNGC